MHADTPHEARQPDLADENRRSFLKWAIHGLSAIFTVVLGFPALMYLINPRHIKSRDAEQKRLAEGIDLKQLQINQPRQGVIRDVRRDAWTLHPNDVIGRVWAVKLRDYDPQTGPDPAKKGAEAELLVFTTVCPHLGCSINLDTEGGAVRGFACPCHNGMFNLNGEKRDLAGTTNPVPRGMDELEWGLDPDPNNRNSLFVKFESFKQMESRKIVKS